MWRLAGDRLDIDLQAHCANAQGIMEVLAGQSEDDTLMWHYDTWQWHVMPMCLAMITWYKWPLSISTLLTAISMSHHVSKLLFFFLSSHLVCGLTWPAAVASQHQHPYHLIYWSGCPFPTKIHWVRPLWMGYSRASQVWAAISPI